MIHNESQKNKRGHSVNKPEEWLSFFQEVAATKQGGELHLDITTIEALISLLDKIKGETGKAETHGEIEQVRALLLKSLADSSGVVSFSEDIQHDILNVFKNSTPEKIRSIIPQKAVFNNSKIAHFLPKIMGDGERTFDVGRGKRPVYVVASLAYDDPTLSISKPYTAYDRAVLNAICSLWEAGNRAFTAAMVYRTMNGLTGTEEGGRNVSPQAVGAVTRSIEKQRRTMLYIDCSSQMKFYNGAKIEKIDSPMLALDHAEMTAQNGQKVMAYKFYNPKRPPALYEYSQSVGQVLSVPSRLLNSTGAIKTTDEIIVLREYLILRIEGMRGQNKLKSSRILYSSIYEKLDINPAELSGDSLKNTARRIRKNTDLLLSHLQAEGFLSSFKEYKDGRQIAGIEITL